MMKPKKSPLPRNLDKVLKKIYYDVSNSGSYTGVSRLYDAVLKAGKYNISRNHVKTWLKSQDAYTLHKPARRHFNRKSIFVANIDELWEMDLIVMEDFAKFNDGYKYILVTIDVLSKYVYTEPLKRKSADFVIGALKKIFKLDKRKPIFLRSDEAREFVGKKLQSFLKVEGIRYYTTINETKACVVERVIKTIKSRMFRYFTHKQTNRYIDILQEQTKSYNSTVHKSIKMSPDSVTYNNQHLAWENNYVSILVKKDENKKLKYKFKVGDYVRVSFLKRVFDKSYQQQWSDQFFQIREQLPTNPRTYRLSDYNGEKLGGAAYEEELQHVIKNKNALYNIEKVIEEKEENGKMKYLVKWQGWPDQFNTWVSAEQVADL